MAVRPQGAGRALGSPQPNTSSELPLLEMMDHQATGIHHIPQALRVSHLWSFSSHFGCAQGKESPGPFKVAVTAEAGVVFTVPAPGGVAVLKFQPLRGR